MAADSHTNPVDASVCRIDGRRLRNVEKDDVVRAKIFVKDPEAELSQDRPLDVNVSTE